MAPDISTTLTSLDTVTAQQIIDELKLEPHPEGGHFVEVFRDQPAAGGRGAVTTIYFLLQAGEVSRWHRVDAVEIWHWYAGAPLQLWITERLDGDDQPVEYLLAPNVLTGARPQAIVPAHAWQSARSLGDWTLVGCTVSPAFEYRGFELADDAEVAGVGCPPRKTRLAQS
ncbi:hypothetical protein VTJ04DRAFT_5837 [Mycothermus thermophilus]|uniref:uncharacterized protein n=1 Tax=Humicola insolens TaxID=85995 RepID=UPI00374327D8